MLIADKTVVEKRTQVRLLQIRGQELAFYTHCAQTVGTIGSVFAGLAFYGLLYVKMEWYSDSALLVRFLYDLGNLVCMCLSLQVVVGTTALSMLCPGLALRGPEGSIHEAVDGMLDEFQVLSP